MVSHQAHKKNHKYARVIGGVVLVYLIAWIPSSIILNFTPFNYGSFATASILVVSNSLLDPLIYYWKIREFREYFGRMLGCYRSGRISIARSVSGFISDATTRKTVRTIASDNASTKFWLLLLCIQTSDLVFYLAVFVVLNMLVRYNISLQYNELLVFYYYCVAVGIVLVYFCLSLKLNWTLNWIYLIKRSI